MNYFIKKLLDRLKGLKSQENTPIDNIWNNAVNECISQVNQFAEEYNGYALCKTREFCDYQFLKDDGWIPCSERLPESGIHVICYGKNSLGSFKYEVSVYAEEIECWMCSKIADVLAWQPLPVPYQPKGESQDG